MQQIVRFTVVVGLGLVVDLALALALRGHLGLALPLAAAAGFAAGALVNYILHEVWTFRQAGAPVRMSARRGGLYLVVLAAGFVTRVGAVAVLQRLLPDPAAAPVVLGLAIGLSFCVNFLLSRGLAFRPATAEPTRPETD